MTDATPSSLNSNIINYLVWRYLQEASFAPAAHFLQKEWHWDPDTLPFAKHYEQGQLWNLVVDGFHLDETIAEVRNEPPRWAKFLEDKGDGKYQAPIPIEMRSAAQRTDSDALALNGRAVSRDGPIADLDPGRKSKGKKRKSNGTDRPSSAGGNAMDIDNTADSLAHSPIPNHELEEEDSPMADEPPLPSTLSIGENKQLQSHAVRDLTRNTTLKLVGSPRAVIDHTCWASEDGNVLYTGGENLSSIHVVPTSTTAAEDITSTAQDMDYSSYSITAAAFASVDMLFLGVCGAPTRQEGEPMSEHKSILAVTPSFQRTIASPSDMVFALRWNAAARSCLAITCNGENSDIWLYPLNSEGSFQSLLPNAGIETTIFDAVWLDNNDSEKRFALCGQDWIREYQIVDDEAREIVAHDSHFQKDCNGRWDRIRYEPNSHIMAVSMPAHDDQDVVIGLIARQLADNVQYGTLTGPQVSGVTDVRFQPVPNPATYSASDWTTLAVATDSGAITLHTLRRGSDSLEFSAARVLQMNVPALCMSYSSDGFLIAAGGRNEVRVWKADTIDNVPEGILVIDGEGSYRLDAHHPVQTNGTVNGEDHGVNGVNGTREKTFPWRTEDDADKGVDLTHAMDWCGSRRLAYTVHNQLAIIDFAK